MSTVWLQYVIGPIVGGLIAASAFILKRSPNSASLMNRIMPYKAMIGVALLVLGVWNAISVLPKIGAHFEAGALWGITALAIVGSEILVGTLLGLPQIAKWISGGVRSEERAAVVSEKLVPYEVPIGFLSISAGVLASLFLLGVL